MSTSVGRPISVTVEVPAGVLSTLLRSRTFLIATTRGLVAIGLPLPSHCGPSR